MNSISYRHLLDLLSRSKGKSAKRLLAYLKFVKNMIKRSSASHENLTTKNTVLHAVNIYYHQIESKKTDTKHLLRKKHKAHTKW